MHLKELLKGCKGLLYYTLALGVLHYLRQVSQPQVGGNHYLAACGRVYSHY